MQIERTTPAPTGRQATIRCDGSCPSNPGPMGIGFLITFGDPACETEYSTGTDGRVRTNEIQFGTRFGPGSNNRAEYLSLIYAMRRAILEGVTHVTVFMDSLLVVNHMSGSWTCKDGTLKRYLEEARGLAALFTSFKLLHVDREENTEADFLSHNPTDSEVRPPEITIYLTGKRTRKISRQQAAMIRWWWKTRRCRNEYRLSRIFDCAPSYTGSIGRGENCKDITTADLPHEELTYAI